MEIDSVVQELVEKKLLSSSESCVKTLFAETEAVLNQTLSELCSEVGDRVRV